MKKKLGWSDKKLIFLSYQPSIFFIFYAILKILRVPSKKRQFIFNFIMTFSPGQNGKGFEKIKQIGKLKKNGFCKQKRQSRDKTRPAFTKETTIVQPNALRKALREKKERFTHHQVPRSPQRRQPPITWPIEVIETVSPCIMSSDSLVTVSPIAEPLSSASLVAQEVIPRELRSAKNNNKKRKNYGKNSPTFILKLYICFFIVILKTPHRCFTC